MSTKIKIPAGWRRLRKGDVLRDGDKGWFPANTFGAVGKFEFTAYAGERAGNRWADATPYIRRIPKKRKES